MKRTVEQQQYKEELIDIAIDLSGPPTEKQKSYANAIAYKLKIDMPKGCKGDFYKFIKKHKPQFEKKIEEEEKKSREERKIKEEEEKRLNELFKECRYMKRYAYLFDEDALKLLLDRLNKVKGCYCFVRKDNEILYIGKSKNLALRIPSSYKERMESAEIDKILYYPIESMADVHVMEMLLIAENNPLLNQDGKTEEVNKIFKSGVNVLKDFKFLECGLIKGVSYGK